MLLIIFLTAAVMTFSWVVAGMLVEFLDGKYTGQQDGVYSNTARFPFNYFYEWGFRWGSRRKVTVSWGEKNKELFGRD